MPDVTSWKQMVKAWAKIEAPFTQGFTSEDPGIFARVVSDQGMDVTTMVSTWFGRRAMIAELRGAHTVQPDGASISPKVFVDVVPEGMAYVFVKAGSIDDLADAIVRVQPLEVPTTAQPQLFET